MKISVFRKAHFNAAHRLFNPTWDDAKNEAVFGPCANPHYHGHNYEMEVKVTGEIDPDTGYLIDLKVLKDLIKEHVEDVLDHRNLNEEISHFKDVNPTAEHICIFIYNQLRPHLKEKFELQIRLFETPRNFVEYPVH